MRKCLISRSRFKVTVEICYSKIKMATKNSKNLICNREINSIWNRLTKSFKIEKLASLIMMGNKYQMELITSKSAASSKILNSMKHKKKSLKQKDKYQNMKVRNSSIWVEIWILLIRTMIKTIGDRMPRSSIKTIISKM